MNKMEKHFPKVLNTQKIREIFRSLDDDAFFYKSTSIKDSTAANFLKEI